MNDKQAISKRFAERMGLCCREIGKAAFRGPDGSTHEVPVFTQDYGLPSVSELNAFTPEGTFAVLKWAERQEWWMASIKGMHPTTYSGSPQFLVAWVLNDLLVGRFIEELDEWLINNKEAEK